MVKYHKAAITNSDFPYVLDTLVSIRIESLHVYYRGLQPALTFCLMGIFTASLPNRFLRFVKY